MLGNYNSDVKFNISILLLVNLAHSLHILTCIPKIANKANNLMADDCTLYQAAPVSRIIKLLGNHAVTVAIIYIIY